MKKIIFFLFVGLATTALLAQTGQIQGKVLNEQHQPVADAEIKVHNLSKTTFTTSDGEYVLTLNPGTYILEINANQLFPHKEKISIEANTVQEINILLQEKVELEQIELFGALNKPPEKLDQITRLPLKPNENIQTITTISEKVIEKQGILTISDAVRNAPGLYTYATYGNRSESIGGRGFRGLPVLKNGVRVHSDFRGQGFLTDLQGIESVQVIKGAATISQGFGLDLGAPGGVVNLVTKVPDFKNFGEVAFRYGSWNQIRPTIDINQVLNQNKTLAFRINGAYEHSDGYRDHNSNNRFYVNPSLRFMPNDKWDLKFEMDYLDDKRTPDPGTVNLSADNTQNLIYDLPKEQFLGFESNELSNKNFTYSTTVKYNVNDRLYVRAGFYGSNLDTDGYTTSLRQIVNDQGIIEHPTLVNRSIGRSPFRKDDNLIGQFDVVLHNIYSGAFKHLAQIGADVRNTKVQTKNFGSIGIDQIDILSNEITNTLPNEISFRETGSSDQTINQLGILAQYVVEYKNWARFFAGLRFSDYQDTSTNGRLNTETGLIDFSESNSEGTVWNPLLGIMVYPKKEIAVFASYTTNSNPRSASSLDQNGDQLGNETSGQFEVGVKTEWFRNRLRFNTTYFRVENRNMIMQDVGLNDEGNLEFLPWYVKGGDDLRQGIEMEIIGRITKTWEVMAGYSWLNAEYQNSTRFVDGSRPNNTPEHVANLWTHYAFDDGKLAGFNVGAGVYYLGKRPYNDHVFTAYHGITPDLAPWDNQAYTTVNAQLGYTFNQFGVKLFFNNIFDQIGYNAYRNVYINRIDPRNFAIQLNYKF